MVADSASGERLTTMSEWTNPGEREYDALNDVDGGEDDDVDNIAEAGGRFRSTYGFDRE